MGWFDNDSGLAFDWDVPEISGQKSRLGPTNRTGVRQRRKRGGTIIASTGAWSNIYTQIAMAELLAQVADKIDRAVQRVTPFAYRMQRKGRRWMRRAMRKPRSVSEGPNLLPLLIQVLASFSKADGVLLEEEIDSSLGFLRYDYPEAVYSELRQLFRQALYEQQDLTAMARASKVLPVPGGPTRSTPLGIRPPSF